MEYWFRLARPPRAKIPPRPMAEGRLRLTRRSRAGSTSPDDCTLLLHNDEHRVQQDIRVNRSIEGHALHACRKVPSGYDGTGALNPFRPDRARTVL